MKLKKMIKKFIPWMDMDEKIYKIYLKSNYFYKKKCELISYRYFYKNFKKFNCYISPKAELSEKINFKHPMGIVIGAECKIGKNVSIYQNVTLGRKKGNLIGCPTIGDNVVIYCNSVIIGNVKIGNNAVIGCNSVVLRDVKDGEVVSGVVK